MADEYSELETVKDLLGITGDYQNKTLTAYIGEVKEYMLDAGVDEKIVNSKCAAGVIARGVSDLWTCGDGKLSTYFCQRVAQLSYSTPPEETEDTGNE